MTDGDKRAAYRVLEERVLSGQGHADAQQRARAFANEVTDEPLRTLVGKVAERPADVTEADVDAVTATGLTEDQVFELVVCAAVGKSPRLSADDMRRALAAGATATQLEDALAVAVAFNTTNRLADAFGFELLTPKGYAAGAKYLLKRGYAG